MRTATGILAVATALAVGSGALEADDACCVQGDAKPWSLYNKGVKWRAELSLDPLQGRSSARAALAGADGLSLAARNEAVTAKLKASSKDGWKEELAPVAAAAAKEGKLILFWQLVGDMKREGC